MCRSINPTLIALMVMMLGESLPGKCSQEEERLVRDLFRGYNKLIRPVQNMTQTVQVAFGLAFIQLINVNEKNQIMKSNVWLRFVWNDYQLQWDEAEYGGISVLRLPPDKVWKPDIVLFNNADGNYEVRYKSNVLIYPDGEILWVPPAIYQSSCTIDVTYFPFDQQTCIMKFGSWTFTGDQVSLRLYNNKNYVDLSDYWKSGTWDIVEVPAYLNVHNDSTPTETDITFFITIRRKTLFYTVNLILPTVLISFLCVLVFYLPAEAGEKVTLGISILLSLVVFLLLVSKILPPTSLVLPLIAKYLLFTFIMNTVSILVTVVIINWNFRGPRTHSMPDWMRIIFLRYLPLFLLMRRPKKTRLRWMVEKEIGNIKVQTDAHNPWKGSRIDKSVSDGNKGYEKQLSSKYIDSCHVSGLQLCENQEINSNSNDNHMPIHEIAQHHELQAKSNPIFGHSIASHRCQDNLTSLSVNNVYRDEGSTVSSGMQRHNIASTSDPKRSCLMKDDNDIRQALISAKSVATSSNPTRNTHQSTGLAHCDRTAKLNNICAQTTVIGNKIQSKDSKFDDSFHRQHKKMKDKINIHDVLDEGTLSSATSSTISLEKLRPNRSKVNVPHDVLRASKAVEFIAEHLRNEDEYIQIREDWKFLAMVVDRLQLYIFFIITTVGTVRILMDAPFIFEFVDQDKIIDIYRGK